jgi:hypothetical protein
MVLGQAHHRAYELLQLEPHFDPDLRFKQYEQDPVTGEKYNLNFVNAMPQACGIFVVFWPV